MGTPCPEHLHQCSLLWSGYIHILCSLLLPTAVLLQDKEWNQVWHLVHLWTVFPIETKARTNILKKEQLILAHGFSLSQQWWGSSDYGSCSVWQKLFTSKRIRKQRAGDLLRLPAFGVLVPYIDLWVTSYVCSEVCFNLLDDSKSSQVGTEDEPSYQIGAKEWLHKHPCGFQRPESPSWRMTLGLLSMAAKNKCLARVWVETYAQLEFTCCRTHFVQHILSQNMLMTVFMEQRVQKFDPFHL